MDQRQIDLALDQHMIAVRAIALAFMGSVAFYFVVGWLLVVHMEMGPMVELPLAVVAAIGGAGICSIIVGYAVSRSILAQPRGSGADVRALLQRYMKALVIACAMREAAAIGGFVLSLLTGDLTWVLVLGAAAMFSMIVHWPRRDGVADWMQQRGGP